MKRLLLAALVLPLVPLCARAQEGPERLLSAGSQVYIRWDGLEKHKAAFDKTALSKVFQGDLGEMIAGLLGDKKEHHLARLTKALGKQGLVIGIEVRGGNQQPPEGQLIAVLPDAKAQWEPFFGTMTWAADQNGVKIEEKEVAGRTVYQVQTPGAAQMAFWKEGKEAVLIVGTDTPAATIKRWDDKGPRLPDSPLYKKVSAFKEFTPALRGFVDVASLVKLARNASPEVPKFIDELGLDGFKDLTFYYGFDGAATRSLIALEVPGPRKGLAKFANAQPFTLDDLPALPSDMAGFTAVRLDPLAIYDTTVELLEKLLPAKEAAQVKINIAKMNLALGINLREDLLASLGTMVVTYASPAEGMLFLGQTVLFQVKDAKKLQASLDKMVKNLGEAAQVKLDLKQKDYHGAKLSQVYIHERGAFVVPSYAIHKGWLAVGLYPQPVQGFILRAGGDLPAWKPDAAVKTAFDRMPGKYTMMAIDDPRPGVRFVLSLAPLVSAAVASNIKDADFDVSVLPHAQTVLGHLFTNVTVATDDGKTWKLQSLSSIPLPVGLSRMDNGAVLLFGAITTLGRSASSTFKQVGPAIEQPRKE